MRGRSLGALTPVALRAPSVSAPPKPELSTLLRTGTFYFALTSVASEFVFDPEAVRVVRAADDAGRLRSCTQRDRRTLGG